MASRLLASLSDQDRRRVLAAARRRRYGRREVLFHEGDPADCLHLIDSGRVAVRVATPVGDVATLTVLGREDVLGELSLLDEPSRRSATAIALERTETLTIHRDTFFELREAHSGVDRFLVQILANQVSRLSAHVLEALYLDADTRVLRRVLALAQLYGDGAAGTTIPLTQEDLASLAGTSRATVNRVLGENGDALAVRRGGVTVVDPELLRHRAR